MSRSRHSRSRLGSRAVATSRLDLGSEGLVHIPEFTYGTCKHSFSVLIVSQIDSTLRSFWKDRSELIHVVLRELHRTIPCLQHFFVK